MAKASDWMRAHFDDSDGVGAIFPPIIYTIISLKCLGYADDSAEMIYAIKQLEDLMIEEDETLARAALLFAGVGHGPGP